MRTQPDSRAGVSFRIAAVGFLFSMVVASLGVVSTIPSFTWSRLFSMLGWTSENAMWFLGPIGVLVLIGLVLNPRIHSSG